MHTFFCQWSLKIFCHTIFTRPWVFSWWCLVRLWFCGGDAVVVTRGWPHDDHPSPSTCMRSVTGLAATPHSLAPLWSIAWCTLFSWCPAAVLLCCCSCCSCCCCWVWRESAAAATHYARCFCSWGQHQPPCLQINLPAPLERVCQFLRYYCRSMIFLTPVEIVSSVMEL